MLSVAINSCFSCGVKHFSALWWEAEAPLAGEGAESMPQGVQGTLEYSSHYIRISSNDNLINYRPWSTDQEKGCVTLNPFPASPWVSAVEQGLGSDGEASPARWHGLRTFTGAVSVPLRSILPADLYSASWNSLQGCPPAVLHGANVGRLAALGRGAGSWQCWKCSLEHTGVCWRFLVQHLSAIKSNVWGTEPFWVMPIKCTAHGTSWHLTDCKVRCLLNGVFRLSREFLSEHLHEGPLSSPDLAQVCTSCRLIATYLLGVTFSLKESHSNLFRKGNLPLLQYRQTFIIVTVNLVKTEALLSSSVFKNPLLFSSKKVWFW